MTEQEKREKVIKGLGETLRYCHEMYNGCNNDGQYKLACMNQAAKDAIALLKTQEPRVMTLEEIEDWDGPVYFEEIDTNEYYALIETVALATENKGTYVFMNVMPGEHHRRAWDGAYYNILWRCWTSLPDEKRRAEVPWE